MEADIAILGAAVLKEGVPHWQANVAVQNDTDDIEPLGEVQIFQGLGLDSMAYPKDESGNAEGVVLRDCGGRAAVCVGARDTRNNELVGKLQAGDTTLHTSGPGSVAQCFLKHKKKQAGLATEDANGKTMMFLLDGKNKKAQLAARGAMIQIGEDGDISLVNKEGAGILIQGSKIYILGELSLPGMTPGLALMQGPPVGDPTGAAPLFAVQGVGK